MVTQRSVSVIATVLNEGDAIRRLLDSLLTQTHPADEIIVVDGGSQDNTVANLRAYQDRLPLRILVEPGCNISQGRNRAIATAQHEIIAATDAGVWLEPGWLAALLAPFQQPGATAEVVAGFFQPDATTPFEIAMGATVLPALADIDPAVFLPSSRSVAFTRAAWQRAGGYPEWLDYCEDLVFDFRLRDVAGPFAWAPGAIAHFRPRSSLSAFFTQYYRYARGDGKADLWRRRHAIRYAIYLIVLPLLLGHAFRGRRARAVGWLGLLLGLAAYNRRPWQRLGAIWEPLTWPQRLLTLGLAPVIRVVGDAAKMIGYPVGVWWRWRRRRL
ncbi:glycosyltransferase [Candidatus Amarolinea aalborgensis]|uniref:glycosyltransferase n=1 Tax=Candidatus Amarolinea aalborgensis TaxID=2249329 RepID=UPI003BF9552E